MIPCKFTNLLFHMFPVRVFQSFLIKNHFERCPDCQNSLVKMEDLRLFFVKEEKAFEMASLRPGIREKLIESCERKSRTSLFIRWRWALSAAVLTVLVLTGFLYLNGPDSTKMAFQQDLGQPFQINYIKVEEKPAGTYVYEPEDSEMIFVWAEEILP